MSVVARVQAETGTRVSPRELLLNSLEQIAAQLALPGAPPAAPRAAAEPAAPGGMLSRLRGKIFGS
jgi:hypothetical protein